MGNLADNKQVVLHFYEIFYNQKEFDLARELMTESFIDHRPRSLPGREHTLSSFQADCTKLFPNLCITVDQITAEGDRVWTYGTLHNLLHGESRSVDIWRIADGKIAEHWSLQHPPTHPNQ
jgi:predicted SnoaL-like aldol condensation-catalyzing enzyme